MAKRPTQTLVLITRQHLVRADVVRGEVVELWQQANTLEVEDAALQVEAALALGPKPAARVFVLSSELWTQTLSVASSATGTLSGAELSGALAYEAEPLSGIGVVESALGHQLLQRKAGQHHYWITQGRSDEIERIKQVVHSAGGRLQAICHPGGLPVPLASDARQAWQRLELWPNAIVCMYAAVDKPVQVLVINADPEEHRWRAEKEEWEQVVGLADQREVMLVSGEILSYPSGGEPEVALEREQALRSWLAGWARHLQGKNPQVPVLRPAKQAMPQETQMLLVVALFVLAIGFCVAHHVLIKTVWLPPLERELNKLTAETQQFKALVQQKAAGEKERSQLNKASDELRGKIDLCETMLEAHRWRLARLLASLADDLPRDLFVHKIESNKETPFVYGMASGSQMANAYAARLSEKLRPFGWQAALREQTFARERGLYEFAIALEEVAPTGSPPPTTQSIHHETLEP